MVPVVSCFVRRMLLWCCRCDAYWLVLFRNCGHCVYGGVKSLWSRALWCVLWLWCCQCVVLWFVSNGVVVGVWQCVMVCYLSVGLRVGLFMVAVVVCVVCVCVWCCVCVVVLLFYTLCPYGSFSVSAS